MPFAFSITRNTLYNALLLNPQRFKEPRYLLLVFSILAGMIAMSVVQGVTAHIGDFSVFWIAGDNFMRGTPMYTGTGSERFIYPPFAAMLFQLFALMPFKVANGLFSFVNFILLIFSISLSRAILLRYVSNVKRINRILFFSTLLFFRFFWYHVAYTQMNETILVLSLLGVLLILKKQDMSAAVCFTIATFIKVIPIFFLFWLLFRGGVKSWATAFLVAMFCIAAPLLWRGTDTGMQDLNDYYTTFLEPFKEGRVEASFHNHSLSSAIYDITLDMPDKMGLNYNLFHLSESLAKRIYFISFLLLAGLFVLSIAYRWLRKWPVSLSEVCVIFLTSHLLSGITWEYHLVSLVFVYACFLLLLNKNAALPAQLFNYFILTLIVVNALVGPDTVGKTLYHYFGGYGAVTWMMVLLLFRFLYLCFVEKHEFHAAESQTEK